MSVALIYHYWNHSDTPAWQDLRLPLVFSIASFRYFDQKASVYVVNISDKELDWGDYPQFLNFNVIPRPYFHLRFVPLGIDFKEHMPMSVQMLSKPKDITDIAAIVSEDDFICVDADYFFLRDPSVTIRADDPLMVRSNSGYWCFNKKSAAVKDGFDLWKAVCANACLDYEFYQKVLKATKRCLYPICGVPHEKWTRS